MKENKSVYLRVHAYILEIHEQWKSLLKEISACTKLWQLHVHSPVKHWRDNWCTYCRWCSILVISQIMVLSNFFVNFLLLSWLILSDFATTYTLIPQITYTWYNILENTFESWYVKYTWKKYVNTVIVHFVQIYMVKNVKDFMLCVSIHKICLNNLYVTYMYAHKIYIYGLQCLLRLTRPYVYTVI